MCSRLLVIYLAHPLLVIGGFDTGHHVPNAQVIAEIQDHLYHANVFKHGSVEVTFADGVATLTGTVDSIGVKTDAEKATWKDEDVHHVVNKIDVGSAGTTPNQIVNEARRRIVNYYADSIFDNVEVQSQGNALIVTGQVTQPYKKDAVGMFLAHIRGVSAIENRIEVLPLSVDDEDLRIRMARAIYDDPYFASYAETPNPPIHIIVNGGQATLIGMVNSDLDKARAEQDVRSVLTVLPVQDNLRVIDHGPTP